ncbi:MAG: hypothetical protein A2057_02305 [Ignavibacteria bacterium GWA2_35_9]|nr:MAG: hypothetical protein A2057_02305 [Ignavibacteria bacterium GWA2_35_9]
MKKIFPLSFYNPVTLTGAAIALVSFGLILFLTVVETFSNEHKPYMGIIAFVILPAFLLIGLALVMFGILREHRRERLGIAHKHRLPRIDLNDPRHRLVFTIFSVGTILLLVFSAFGSFKAYEYTDSDEFCGTVCHKVMEPEYTAYKFSPHAKVGCVKCHIGPGATWFVRSKLSGAYQVYAVLANVYPKPIPTPIENLRPAQETCEQCHWPQHFYFEKKILNTYYISDEKNTKWTFDLLMKIGGGNDESGVTSGIHWHMNIANEITYATLDSSRLEIPWVKVKSRDGKERIYRERNNKFSDEKLLNGFVKKMDCIDCHNRPSHIYHPSRKSINRFMSIGAIDSDLPYIKSIGVTALEKLYTEKEIALDSIKLIINDFYQNNYPLIAEKKKKSIEKSIKEIQNIYSRNYFPEMKVSWKRFPNHIGHMYSPGCFRCHDGNHISDDGVVLSKDCNVCHTILAQQYEHGSLRVSLEGVEYEHPVDIGNSWKEINCSDCHSKN